MRTYEAEELIKQRADSGESWLEFLRVSDLSAGIYHLPVGATDLQHPHSEDEVYYILNGRGQIHVAGENRPVKARSMVYVAKHDNHYFHSIVEDLDILVLFAPAEYTHRQDREVVMREDGYSISTNPADLDFEIIHTYLSRESYWAKGRSRNRMRLAIQNSLCYGIYFGDDQVGFARVITDFATRAYLSDVFVVIDHRGRGLGKWLMQTILEDPRLVDVPSWILHTMDAHGLYEQFGFGAPRTPDSIMEFTKNG